MKRIALALAVVTTVTAACTGGSQSAAKGLPAGHGGTLTVVMTQTGGSPYPQGDFDPQESGYPAALGVARCCLFRTLMSYNGAATNGGGAIPRPDLASGLPSVSSDELTWTFPIKPGIRYAPPMANTQVTAPDFIRGLERDLLPASPKVAKALGCTPGAPCSLGGYYSLYLEDLIRGAHAYAQGKTTTISGLEAPDAHTFVVHLTRPSGDLSYLFAFPATAPIPPKPGDPAAALGVAEGHDLDLGKGFSVGTGPYMVAGGAAVDFSLPAAQQRPAEGAADRAFTLVRNPSWDPATDDLRLAYPDRIVIVGAKSVEEGERLVQKDQADLVFDWNAPVDLVDEYQSSPTLRGRVHTDLLDALSTITLNLAVAPLDDLHVRKAISLAIDKTRLVPTFARDFTTSAVASHIAPDGMENDLLQNYAPYGSGSGDVQAAKAEMARSRFDRNSDGVCDMAVCRGLSFAVPAGDISRRHIAASVKRDLAPIGIDVALDYVNDDTYFADLSDPSAGVGMILIAFAKDFPSASTLFSLTFTSKNFENGVGNPSLIGATPQQLKKWGYSVQSVPSVDDRIQQCEEALFAAQITCWANLDQYMMQNVIPWVPLLSWTGSTIVSSRVTKFSFDQSTAFPSAALDRIALTPGTAVPSP